MKHYTQNATNYNKGRLCERASEDGVRSAFIIKKRWKSLLKNILILYTTDTPGSDRGPRQSICVRKRHQHTHTHTSAHSHRTLLTRLTNVIFTKGLLPLVEVLFKFLLLFCVSLPRRKNSVERAHSLSCSTVGMC